MKFSKLSYWPAVFSCLIFSCAQKKDPNKEMVEILNGISNTQYASTNNFNSLAKLAFYDSVLTVYQDGPKATAASFYKSIALLENGDEQDAVNMLEKMINSSSEVNRKNRNILWKALGIAYMRLGERTNCLHNHGAQSCLLPIKEGGVHTDPSGSSNAIRIYEMLLKSTPDDMESRWLLNIAYMTIGGYPKNVPAPYLIKGIGEDTAGAYVQPFTDLAVNTGLNTNNLAGGSIIEDFDNDNYLDLMTSSWSLKEGMHYCRNNGLGTFSNVSVASGLAQFTGGLNMMQTDYNNDGLKDVFVLRGAWKGIYGKEPNSLLRNNGDGTFTDVTIESGLLSYHPTQTATWNDFNRDGWLDLFIGNETASMEDVNECEFYLNNGDGTFTETAVKSGVNFAAFVKGVSSGDYDNDGWPDIFISTLGFEKILLKNEGVKNGIVQFRNVTMAAGLGKCTARTFPTCFFDFDNDGWLDLLVCSYEFSGSLSAYSAQEALGMDYGNGAKQFLYRNKGDGSFEDVTDKVGLNKVAFAMGMNFGDIDNDGWLDLYLGTGNPMYQSLVPNKMFKNMNGHHFMDATGSARVGNLQKGHGVSFADLDSDGDQDIYIEMGGAFTGDAYQNSLFMNPGQNTNNWINLKLEGTKSNRAAIGAKIKVSFTEAGVQRFVYRELNSGGSFGSNPLLQHIGIGKATMIDQIEIIWPSATGKQVFKQIKPGQSLALKEGNAAFTAFETRKVDFATEGGIRCAPSN